MKKIFISYRRDDTAVFTGRIFDRLVEYFGNDSVFLDIDSIPSAVDFREEVKRSIHRCGVFLAIIGKQWTGPSSSVKRIDDPKDYVRIEVEQAFVQNKPVIPVYCGDTKPLKPEELPESLARLAFVNACQVDAGRDFNAHVNRLLSEIGKLLLPTIGTRFAHATRRFVRRNAKALAICAVIISVVWIMHNLVGRLLLSASGRHAVVESVDPSAFSNGTGGIYQIARGLPDRTALVSETHLVQTIRQTRYTFDVFAISASSFINNTDAINDAIDQGVKFRFVVVDYGKENLDNVKLFHSLRRNSPERIQVLIDNARQAAPRFRDFQNRAVVAAQGTGRGSLQARWWKGPFLNSFWVRDSQDSRTALGHVEVSFYGDSSSDPSVRFGSLCPRMITSLQDQFEYLWGKAALTESDYGK